MNTYKDHAGHAIDVEVREVVRYDVINQKVTWQIGWVLGQRELIRVCCRQCDVELEDVTLEYDDEIDFSVLKKMEE